MTANKSDQESIAWALKVLTHLGCPQVRRAEGTDEWRSSQGSYRWSPDLVAGPLVGGGHPSDFYIDVFEPTGDQYVNPLAGRPDAAVKVLRAIVKKETLNVADLDTSELVYATMIKKFEKYAAPRNNSSMLGLVMYYVMTGNQYAGPIFSGLTAPLTLDRVFGITQHLGPKAKDRIMKDLLSPGQSFVGLTLPMEHPLSFVMTIVMKTDGPRVVFVMNKAAKDPSHPYAKHPAIRWLDQIPGSTKTAE